MQLILALPLPYCKNFVFAILSRNIKKNIYLWESLKPHI